MTDKADPDALPAWQRALLAALVPAEDAIDRVRSRIDRRFGLNRPRHISAYRGFGDADHVELMGRVLADPQLSGPGDNDSRWRNLYASYKRFETDEVPNEPLVLEYGPARAEPSSDDEGYFNATLPGQPGVDALWAAASVSLADGSLRTPLEVLLVGADATVGVISDIDDTLLESSITDWKVAAQLTFLHNARTRKPLKGAAKLYQALQAGADGRGRVPIFYVSSSPWNLHGLLQDFMALNGIPNGPMFLRDFGLDAGKFIKSPGHGHKLERVRRLVARFPQLRWVLLGDSGQSDAGLYARVAQEFGDRIAAIYIRDVDEAVDTPLDLAVNAQMQLVAQTRVPMMLASDSSAIARHAAQLGLIDEGWVAAIDAEVLRDAARPTLGQAASDAAIDGKSE
ncbi:App1 family protein [Cognatilysobacter lacus]|uniref:DUF2183 domain-containing protein n=1 Tax=Cognatilysobacter lacus TaxID=1643323 RepID=A0A5D8YYS7_9GAMM|nr:phosphatase domain-containing protein [Lysobacter lacus]TZF87888.1 DUF2183 domain-containing protein [Lysobacter lacus]